VPERNPLLNGRDFQRTVHDARNVFAQYGRINIKIRGVLSKLRTRITLSLLGQCQLHSFRFLLFDNVLVLTLQRRASYYGRAKTFHKAQRVTTWFALTRNAVILKRSIVFSSDDHDDNTWRKPSTLLALCSPSNARSTER
jgi:hypothetical protein